MYPLMTFGQGKDLYHYYRQFPNASDGLEGEMWRGRGAANGRGVREDCHPFFDVRKTFYIEIKLGEGREKFHFHIDTGSRHSWVFCKLSGSQPDPSYLGPNGMFTPEPDSFFPCQGEDIEDMCRLSRCQRKR